MTSGSTDGSAARHAPGCASESAPYCDCRGLPTRHSVRFIERTTMTATTTVTLTPEDRDLLSDALGHLFQTAPRRREELIALAERTGLLLTVDA